MKNSVGNKTKVINHPSTIDVINQSSYDEIISKYKVPRTKSKMDVFNEITGSPKKDEPLTRKDTHYNLLYKIAAVFIGFVIVSTMLVQFTKKNVVVPNGEHKIVYLPDNSKVQINAGSSIKYSKLTWFLYRKINLKGEAFFDVKKGNDFKVKTENGTVEVLGTEFNVFSRDDQFSVKCYSGKVLVKDSDLKVELLPNEGYDNSSPFGSRRKNTLSNRSDWRKGEFYFNNTELILVLEEISRQYDIKIVPQGEIKSRQYTGNFKYGEIESVLKMVCLPLQLDYEIRNGVVYIY